MKETTKKWVDIEGRSFMSRDPLSVENQKDVNLIFAANDGKTDYAIMDRFFIEFRKNMLSLSFRNRRFVLKKRERYKGRLFDTRKTYILGDGK